MTQIDRNVSIKTKNIMAARRRLSEESGIPKNEIRITETGHSRATTDYKLTFGDAVIGWVEEWSNGAAYLLINEE